MVNQIEMHVWHGCFDDIPVFSYEDNQCSPGILPTTCNHCKQADGNLLKSQRGNVTFRVCNTCLSEIMKRKELHLKIEVTKNGRKILRHRD